MVHDEWLEAISAAADGELDEAGAARLDAHLVDCADCTALLTRFEADRRRARVRAGTYGGHLVQGIVDARAGDHVDADRARTALLRRCSAAALGVAAAVLALVLVTSGTTPAPSLGAHDDHDALIAAKDQSFDRADIEVDIGTTVEWRNAGTRTHHLVREFDGVTVDQDLPPGRTETATFDEPGTFAYFCTIHPQMAGTVTVDA